MKAGLFFKKLQKRFYLYGLFSSDIINAASEQLKLAENEVIFIPGFEAACIKVRMSDGGEQMMAWQPYEVAIPDSASLNGKADLQQVNQM